MSNILRAISVLLPLPSAPFLVIVDTELPFTATCELTPPRANHGDGRQMWPSQTIHRSVLRRLEVEQLAKVADKQAYKPAAKPAEFWPAWTALKAGTAKLPADLVGEFVEE